ncbi:MAG: sulfatase-like hydrolase/transferase, partial [Rubripirellula sp.]
DQTGADQTGADQTGADQTGADQTGADQTGARPNILLVMADDQGWGDMAYNGHESLVTPNFDQAAAEGLRLDRFYAAAPVCSPTRASVMTGRTPNRMGVFKWGYPMRPQETTIAEVLKSAGYATGHFGKWHLGSVRRESPANPGRNGFDRWLSAANFYDNDPVMSDEGTAVQMTGESSIIAADAALEWMEEVSRGDQPFFGVVWFGSPHAPHRAAAEDRAHYQDQPKPAREFLGEVTGMDRAFGKLRDGLGELGVRENTILWYCSDNGALPKVGSTGGYRGQKGKVYEGGLLVPAIIEWPARIKSPRQSEMRATTCDIFPTLVELVGVEVQKPRPLDGISLAALIDQQKEGRTRPIGFWDYTIGGISTPSDQWMKELLKAQADGGDLPPHPSSQKAAELPSPPLSSTTFPGHSAWIEGDWKLHRIEDKKGKVTIELYDLANDRVEEDNQAVGQVKRATRMQSELEEWLVSVVGSLNGEDYESR